MTSEGAAGIPAASLARDLRSAAPIVCTRGLVGALLVAAAGQLVPAVANLAGTGLAVATQLRVGWLITMAGHAVSLRAISDPAGAAGASVTTLDVRFGLLTIAALGAAASVVGGRAAARPVADRGMRRAIAGATIAVPYAVALGTVNAVVTLSISGDGSVVPASASIEAARWEGFVLPALLATVAGALGGWSSSSAWGRGPALAVRAGLATFAWATGLALVGLLAFAALRPEGLARYAREVGSHGPRRAAVSLGLQMLTVPDHAMWVLAPSMGSCVTVRSDGSPGPVLCLDRIPRGRDPLAWLFGEIGRVDGDPATAPMPPAAFLFLVVPAGAVVLGMRRLAAHDRWMPACVGAGAVFAAAVVVTSLAATLWVRTTDGDAGRTFALGPDPLATAIASLSWGVVGGLLTCGIARSVSSRARPR